MYLANTVTNLPPTFLTFKICGPEGSLQAILSPFYELPTESCRRFRGLDFSGGRSRQRKSAEPEHLLGAASGSSMLFACLK